MVPLPPLSGCGLTVGKLPRPVRVVRVTPSFTSSMAALIMRGMLSLKADGPGLLLRPILLTLALAVVKVFFAPLMASLVLGTLFGLIQKLPFTLMARLEMFSGLPLLVLLALPIR